MALPLAVQQEPYDSVTNQPGMNDLSCYAIAFLCACNKHLATYQNIKPLTIYEIYWNIYDGLLDVYLKFQNGGSRACSSSNAS